MTSHINNDQTGLSQDKLLLLLDISSAIASVADRSELLGVIMEKIKPAIRIDDLAIVIFNENNTQWKDLAVFEEYLQTGTSRELSDAGYDQWIPIDTLVDAMRDKTGIITIDEILKHKEFPFGEIMRKAGLKEFIYTPLTTGQKTVGFVVLDAEDYNSYSEEDFPLLKAIANLLAIAVTNILDNEAILKEKREKEDLLKISEAITTIQDKDHLLKVIYEKIQTIFPFESAGLFVVDYELDHHYEIVNEDILDGEFDTTVWGKVGKGPFKHSESTIEFVIEQPPGIYLIKDLIKKHHHPQLQPMYEAGLRQLIAGPLKVGGEKIGMLCFNATRENFFREEHLPMFRNISDQLAITVANVLANRKILEEKKFKEKLLEISEATTNIRDFEDLFKTIMQKIHPIVQFDDAVAITLSTDHKVSNHTLTLSPPSRKAHPMYKEVVSKPLPVAGTPLEKLIAGKTGEYYLLEDLANLYPDFPGIKLMQDTNLNHSAVLKLKNSGTVFGMLIFHFSEIQDLNHPKNKFYPDIADQLSVAINNILANEEILKRSKEKALQIDIANTFIYSNDWNSRFLQITRLLETYIPIDYISYSFEESGEWGKRWGYEHISQGEYRYISEEQLAHMSGLSETQANTIKANIKPFESLIADGVEFAILTRKSPVVSIISRLFKAQSCLIISIDTEFKECFSIAIFSKQESIYHSEHLELLKKLSSTIQLSIDKAEALEEIHRLNGKLKQEKNYLEEELKIEYNFQQIVGTSDIMRAVFEKVDQVTATETTVLISGETGTGKELVARALHDRSPRKGHALIKLNCAALPPQLIESELFGHEKGSFTGATDRRIGKFELAHDSTIFLDEIGELSLELQSKLLRVIQEKEIERLGGSKVIKVNVRIITATNRNLEKEVAEGNFRSDLYFRLNVFPITLPPLRERPEDIPHLALHFLKKYAPKVGKKISGIANSSLKELVAYDWPGNVRELEHIIERAIILSKGNTLHVSLEKAQVPVSSDDSATSSFKLKTLKESERELIFNTLKYCGGRIRGKGGATEILDINPSTLESRMRKLGIKRQHIIDNLP